MLLLSLCFQSTPTFSPPTCRPNLNNQQNVLLMAQSAYFLGVVVARWADLLVCKTRKESIFNQVGVLAWCGVQGMAGSLF